MSDKLNPEKEIQDNMPVHVSGTAAVVDWAQAVKTGTAAKNARDAIIKNLLSRGSDFNTIPGCGTKPTLLKPGAEKIADALGLYDEYEIIEKTEDWDKPLFYYKYRCVLKQRGSNMIIATGIGSCNSWESKYRWRKVFAWDATENDKNIAIRTEMRKKKSGQGTYPVYVIPNDDIFTQLNTIDKMAQKRAKVAATLNLGFSEMFTQDIEDNPESYGGYEETEPTISKNEPAKSSPKSFDPTELEPGSTEWYCEDFRKQFNEAKSNEQLEDISNSIKEASAHGYLTDETKKELRLIYKARLAIIEKSKPTGTTEPPKGRAPVFEDGQTESQYYQQESIFKVARRNGWSDDEVKAYCQKYYGFAPWKLNDGQADAVKIYIRQYKSVAFEKPEKPEAEQTSIVDQAEIE
jgi:hypothetical protein